MIPGGTPELIEHESSGLLYFGGYRELERCMARLASDVDLCRQIGTEASRVAFERFTIERYAQQIENVLQNAVS